ncbi:MULTISPECIES: helix-turn-helix transcriptional regulator [unclassified Rhizobium]|uniref:helix-turn-helix domain-containing protein n=1 Tax=unclassified Rhizobium TaxID=2613769 RepID=UPI0018EA33A3
MAIGKLFIGRKVRELRLEHDATQSQFAERLGISLSYLNQIENNQRPVSAAVLLALADKYGLDIAELSTGETDRLMSALTEALGDPLFESYSPTLQELKLIAQNAPGFARALVSCHQAYRRNSEQLASLDDRLGRAAALEATPYDEVRDFFHYVDNYVQELDTMAEALAGKLGLQGGDGQPILTDYLDSQFGIRVVHGPSAMNAVRRYDPAGRVLTLNPYAPAETRTFQMAVQTAQLYASEVVESIVRQAGFRSEEASEVCRIGLHNYFAGALLMPYQSFLKTARDLRHDIELLAARFGTSLEQVCHRLSTLQRPGMKGIPIFFARIDRAGNITKRHSATKLQFARFGAACPLWNAHQAFETPGRFIRQLAETPDGARYLCLATHVSKGVGGFRTQRSSHALALGCEISYASAFVYADDLNVTDKSAFEPIGISCRICERNNCASRAVPPLRRSISVDHNVRETTPYQLS